MINDPANSQLPLLLYGVYLSAQRKVEEANTDIELDLDGYKCNIDGIQLYIAIT